MIGISDNRIWTVWHWCSTAFSANGQILRFPKDTAPQKTYQWRYAKKLAKQLNEWEFDDLTCQAFINTAAQYAKDHRLLHKGLAAFSQSNILEVCYDRLSENDDITDRQLIMLADTKRFLDDKCGDESILSTLLARAEFTSPTNYSKWFLAGKIPALYIALSRPCFRALHKLALEDDNERSYFPSRVDLILMAADFSKDKDKKAKAKNILHDEWRELCLRL